MCKYVCQNWSFKYKIQYKIQFYWHWQFERHTQICKSKPWFNHTTITNYLCFTDHNFYIQCIGIFQRWQTKVDLSLPEWTMWYSQSRGNLKLYLNPWQFKIATDIRHTWLTLWKHCLQLMFYMWKIYYPIPRVSIYWILAIFHSRYYL